MDAELQKAVTGLEETRDRLRDEVAAPLRADRGRLREADAQLLLGSLAAVVESLRELAGLVAERQYDDRYARWARPHLKTAWSLLRDGAEQAGRKV